MDVGQGKQPTEMRFALATPEAQTAVLTISGELDLSNIDQLEAAVDPLLGDGLTALILEVGELRFADSSAIALWVQWATRVRHLELREPPELLRRVITTMGLAERLRLTP